MSLQVDERSSLDASGNEKAMNSRRNFVASWELCSSIGIVFS
jgi:hypothetical protein